MKASPKTIWQIPVYLPYLQPPLTVEMITEAQQQIGFRLPEAYLALLREQNGGYIRYRLPEHCNDQIYGIGPYFPSLTRFDWESSREQVSYKLDGLIPFDGDGHWHLCLDYRNKSSDPAVTYVDIECDRETPVAATFEAYLSMLVIDVSENDFVLPNISDPVDTLNRLAAHLGIQVFSTDSFAHGYPSYRARGGFEKKPEWVWISPNDVRRGFVRAKDRRFEQLGNLMPENAPRYPQLPESSYLLTTTDGLRSAVRLACSELSINIRPLIEYAMP